MSLRQIELVWVRVRVEGECFWVNQRRKISVWFQHGRNWIQRWQNLWLQNSWWPPSSSWVRMNEFESDWISLNQSQSKGRVFLSESERSKQGVWIPQCRSWIQDGGIQDGHYHQIKWEWMSLSQNELVRIRVRVEWGCFEWIWEKINKVSESNIAVSESEMAEFKMAAITKLSENEWDWVSLN